MSNYQAITDKILGALESGVIPWRKPWRMGLPQNLTTGKPYRGVNLLLLSFSPFTSPYYLTYKQAEGLGGNVKKGAKGFQVCFWSRFETEDKSTGLDVSIPYVKLYTVFNIEQCENITMPMDNRLDFKPIAECEKVINGMPARPEIKASNRACYIPSNDVVEMPSKFDFISESAWYDVLFHELAHSTGHESRLNRRNFGAAAAFGSETYSKEELVAEMASAFLCGYTGIEQHTLPNQAAYIASWLKALKDDRNMVIQAASAAQKAADYILGKGVSNV